MFHLANNGYSMKFENGYTVSVRWHECTNYVSNRSMGTPGPYVGTWISKIKAMASNSVDAEVAVKDKAGNFLRTPFNEVDDVIGWQSPKQVLEIMNWTAGL